MQVTCLGFNWDEVRKRPNAAAVLEEMIATDDVDAYSTSLPEGMWQFDSATLHFEVAGVLVALRDAAGPEARPPLDAIAELISTGDSIDELGLSTLTDGCYFVTLSPERLDILNEAFARLDRPTLSKLYVREKITTPSEEEFFGYLDQWRAAVQFAHERGLGLVAHCG